MAMAVPVAPALEHGMEWNVEWNGMRNSEYGMDGVWKSDDVHFVALKIRPSTVIVTMPAATSCPLERKHF